MSDERAPDRQTDRRGPGSTPGTNPENPQRMPRRRRGERALGPYRHGRGWRVIEVTASGRRTSLQFESKREAGKYVAGFNDQVVAQDHTTETALEEYMTYLRRKGNKPGSIDRTEWSIDRFFPEPVALWSLTERRCRKRYETLTDELAVDSHRNALAEVKTFLSWCAEQGWLRANPAANIKGIGRRNRRKKQLRIRDVRAWYQTALDLAAADDDGAIAALMTLILGMRSTEIVTRTVGDVDADLELGDLLWIPDSKTEAGRRTLEVPPPLCEFLGGLAEGKPRHRLLFVGRGGKGHWRDWPRKQVHRICDLAGVPRVSAHGMRGALATIAVGRGLAPRVVADALGHEDERTTLGAYSHQDAARVGAATRGLAILNRSQASTPESEKN